MTCSRWAISNVAASSRSMAVRGGPFSCSRKRAIFLLLLSTKGLNTMASTSATSKGSPRAAGLAPDGNHDAGAQRLESRRREWPADQRRDGSLQHVNAQEHGEYQPEAANQ